MNLDDLLPFERTDRSINDKRKRFCTERMIRIDDFIFQWAKYFKFYSRKIELKILLSLTRRWKNQGEQEKNFSPHRFKLNSCIQLSRKFSRWSSRLMELLRREKTNPNINGYVCSSYIRMLSEKRSIVDQWAIEELKRVPNALRRVTISFCVFVHENDEFFWFLFYLR